ncbi:MAG: hypothetical protein D6711_04380 [Chloroflexi bacterium]|nr:MAG: hypothetical protein D6711_04380 [Chloroflexota bacterium]
MKNISQHFHLLVLNPDYVFPGMKNMNIEFLQLLSEREIVVGKIATDEKVADYKVVVGLSYGMVTNQNNYYLHMLGHPSSMSVKHTLNFLKNTVLNVPDRTLIGIIVFESLSDQISQYFPNISPIRIAKDNLQTIHDMLPDANILVVFYGDNDDFLPPSLSFDQARQKLGLEESETLYIKSLGKPEACSILQQIYENYYKSNQSTHVRKGMESILGKLTKSSQ